MEHHFTGPDYTIGIEEELMIVDGETLDLVNAIESLVDDAPQGAIKPELMESVLEISTDPCDTISQAGTTTQASAARTAEKAPKATRRRRLRDVSTMRGV